MSWRSIWSWMSWISSRTDLWFGPWWCTNMCMDQSRSWSRSCPWWVPGLQLCRTWSCCTFKGGSISSAAAVMVQFHQKTSTCWMMGFILTPVSMQWCLGMFGVECLHHHIHNLSNTSSISTRLNIYLSICNTYYNVVPSRFLSRIPTSDRCSKCVTFGILLD